ncbi:MAG: VOC family protein [Candidatus Eremiobacteraeota bacterium]|nr:VOC family protein [Candidatus Eremiobacteraeota bacterium]
MANPVVHFEIMTKDPEALIAFYREAFDWDIDTQDHSGGPGVPKYFMARPNGEERPSDGINGGIGGAPDGYDGHCTFYIAVDDVGAALEKVERLGATRMMGPDQVPNGPIIGLFIDPQGHTIGLVNAD